MKHPEEEDMDSKAEVVVLSGWHSGPNPSPGLGTASAIRMMWPNTEIHALDYSSSSTGLQSEIISKRHILPSWEHSDLGTISEAIKGIVSAHAGSFISGLDLETHLLSQSPASRLPSVLVPPATALEAVRKPSRLAAEAMALKVPRSHLFEDARSATTFAANCGWPIWVKGAHYEAISARSPSELEALAAHVQESWSGAVLIQEHVRGREESIAFASIQGELINACAMRKTMTTTEGKTWGGRVQALTEETSSKLQQLLGELNWTGGGEIELVKSDLDESLFLIDFNPRFPAWIFGAALAGFNLPGELLGALWKQTPRCQSQAGSAEFVRVVVEIPVILPTSHHESIGKSPLGHEPKGHPSGMPLLSQRLFSSQRVCDPLPVDLLDGRWPEIERGLVRLKSTSDGPVRISFDAIRHARFKSVNVLASRIGQKIGIPIFPSYSLKTNPSETTLSAALQEGFGAEAISLAEVEMALRAGFHQSAVILNGPGKWWPQSLKRTASSVRAVNCDSVEDFEETLRRLHSNNFSTQTLGVRLSPISVSSRFGVNLQDPQQFATICRLVGEIPESIGFGIHFHHAASSIGCERWVREVKAAIAMSRAIEDVSGRGISVFDFGGGWRDQDMSEYESALSEVAKSAQESLTSLRSIAIEPGKLIVEPTSALLARVIEVRRTRARCAAVLGMAVSDLPDHLSFPHEVWWYSQETEQWRVLPYGKDVLYGRICMEHDILRSSISVPSRVKPGDVMAILAVGAYDTSMAFAFGGGDIP